MAAIQSEDNCLTARAEESSTRLTVAHGPILADAIAEQASADAAVEATRAKIARALVMVADTERGLEAAAASVAAIKAHAVATAAATGMELMSTKAMRDARAAELDAQDSLEIAQGARAALAAALPTLQEQAEKARERTAAAAKAVLVSAAPALIERAEAAYAELEGVRAALSFLGSCFPGFPTVESRLVQGMAQRSVEGPDHRGDAGALPWRAALEALMRDADAELPK